VRPSTYAEFIRCGFLVIDIKCGLSRGERDQSTQLLGGLGTEGFGDVEGAVRGIETSALGSTGRRSRGSLNVYWHDRRGIAGETTRYPEGFPASAGKGKMEGRRESLKFGYWAEV
jgi:hypothetical protein